LGGLTKNRRGLCRQVVFYAHHYQDQGKYNTTYYQNGVGWPFALTDLNFFRKQITVGEPINGIPQRGHLGGLKYFVSPEFSDSRALDSVPFDPSNICPIYRVLNHPYMFQKAWQSDPGDLIAKLLISL
jgi:hypothetical protein